MDIYSKHLIWGPHSILIHQPVIHPTPCNSTHRLVPYTTTVYESHLKWRTWPGVKLLSVVEGPLRWLDIANGLLGTLGVVEGPLGAVDIVDGPDASFMLSRVCWGALSIVEGPGASLTLS